MERAEHFLPSLRISANSAVIIELIPAPVPSSSLPPPPLSPSLWQGASPALLRPPLWSLVDEWVSGGPGVRNGSCVCSLPVAVKIYYL